MYKIMAEVYVMTVSMVMACGDSTDIATDFLWLKYKSKTRLAVLIPWKKDTVTEHSGSYCYTLFYLPVFKTLM